MNIGLILRQRLLTHQSMKNRNEPTNGKHTVFLFLFLSQRPIHKEANVVYFYLPAHKELFRGKKSRICSEFSLFFEE